MTTTMWVGPLQRRDNNVEDGRWRTLVQRCDDKNDNGSGARGGRRRQGCDDGGDTDDNNDEG